MKHLKRIIVLIGSIASILLLGVLIGVSYFRDEFFLTEVNRIPILPLTAIDFDRGRSQVPFEIVRSGQYQVVFRLELRSTPEPCEPREMGLSGVLEIGDQLGTILFRKSFSMDLSRCVTGFDVARFDDADVGGIGTKILSFHLVPSQGIEDQYSKIEVGVIRKPRWRFLI